MTETTITFYNRDTTIDRLIAFYDAAGYEYVGMSDDFVMMFRKKVKHPRVATEYGLLSDAVRVSMEAKHAD